MFSWTWTITTTTQHSYKLFAEMKKKNKQQIIIKRTCHICLKTSGNHMAQPKSSDWTI